MGFMHRVKVMLGLADEFDDEYDDEYDEPAEKYDDDEEDAPARPYTSPYGTESNSVRRINREPDLLRARDAAPLRAVPSMGDPGPADSGPQVRIHTIEPRAFSEAQSIADKFKAGQPVIMNLTATEPDLSRRLLDFASGLTYALDGGLQKVSDRVFMLTPRNVDVSTAGQVRSRSASGLFGE
jgi:cell division inhibitor SepF